MAAAVCVISSNKGIHEGLSALLTKQERVEGEALERWLQHVVVSGKTGCNADPGHVCSFDALRSLCTTVMSCLGAFYSAANNATLLLLCSASWLCYGLRFLLLRCFCAVLLQVPDLLRDFVVNGALPSASALQDAAVVPTLMLGEAMQHLKEASAATAAITATTTSSSKGTRNSSSSTGDGSSSSKGISSQSENGF